MQTQSAGRGLLAQSPSACVSRPVVRSLPLTPPLVYRSALELSCADLGPFCCGKASRREFAKSRTGLERNPQPEAIGQGGGCRRAGAGQLIRQDEDTECVQRRNEKKRVPSRTFGDESRGSRSPGERQSGWIALTTQGVFRGHEDALEMHSVPPIPPGRNVYRNNTIIRYGEFSFFEFPQPLDSRGHKLTNGRARNDCSRLPRR
jgi:hypothetical protein